EFGESFYNRGIYNAVLVAEAIRNAQKITGKKAVTGEDVRRGLETLAMTAERWKQLGLPNFAAPVELTCADHAGHGAAFMNQWDGAKWVRASDWILPMPEKPGAMIEDAARHYISKNPSWPARSEPCDQPR